MADINDYINDPTNWNRSPDVVDRVNELRGWSRDKAEKIASEQMLTLTEQHWAFIDYLQHYYIDNGWPERVHELTQHLENTFADQGGGRYLYSLFPGGPIAQGSRVAGLPMPANTENKSKGSVQ